MKPSESGSLISSRSTRVLSVLSFAVLFSTTGCYTKLATNEGDHWGYTGPVKQKVVVRETDDTIVVRETRVIHQPQPVVTDTVTYSNTATGEENVVVNNYFAPPPQTFGAYDPWTNTYPTWYDDYWYRPRAAVVISIGDPYYHPRWFNSHWRRHAYYQSYYDYNYYNPWDNWYHVNYRGPGWAYYDPYYPYPPMYAYGYGCYAPFYDPFAYWPYYGYGYGYGYGGYYDHHYGHGHHGYYGDDNNDDRDHNGRERRRGNVGGEERGRGGVTTDNGSGRKTGVIVPRSEGAQANTSLGEKINGTQVSTRRPVDAGSETATNGGIETIGSGSPKDASSGGRIGNVDISTGEIPVDGGTRNTSSGRTLKSSPSETAPNVYNGSSTRTSTVSATPAPVERRPVIESTTPSTRTTSAPTNVVKNSDASGSRSSTSTPATRSSNTSTSGTSSGSRPSPASQTPSYTPRSSSSSGSSSVSSGSSSSGSRSSSSSSSGSSSSSRGSDSRNSDSRSSSDGGSRGRR
jgi:uncharacterized membrane protein YgcG